MPVRSFSCKNVVRVWISPFPVGLSDYSELFLLLGVPSASSMFGERGGSGGVEGMGPKAGNN